MASAAMQGVQGEVEDAAAASSTGWSESTHFHHWLFSSSEQLQQQRQLCHSQHLLLQLPSSTSSTAPPPPPPPGPASSSSSVSAVRRKERRSASPLSLSDVSALLLYYQLTVASLALRFSPPLPVSVQCTCQLYLHRFYTRHSPHSFHPKQVVLTALLLACKVEEHHISPAKLAEKAMRGDGKETQAQAQAQAGLSERVEEIVRLEVPLLEGLGFHLRCWHPHKAVRALCRITADAQGWTAERRKEVEERSLALVQAAYLTDAVLLHAPSQLALAAVSLALEQLQLPAAAQQQLLDAAFPSSPPPPASLHAALSSLRGFMLAGSAVSAADVRREAAAVDGRLQRVRDRSNDPTSDEWKERDRKRTEEKERRREEKGKKRAEEERRKMEELTMGPAPHSRGGGGGGGEEKEREAKDEDEEGEGFFIIKRQRRDTEEEEEKRSSPRSAAAPPSGAAIPSAPASSSPFGPFS